MSNTGGRVSNSWRGQSGQVEGQSPICSHHQPRARDFPHLTWAPLSMRIPISLPQRGGLGAREVERLAQGTQLVT